MTPPSFTSSGHMRPGSHASSVKVVSMARRMRGGVGVAAWKGGGARVAICERSGQTATPEKVWNMCFICKTIETKMFKENFMFKGFRFRQPRLSLLGSRCPA